MTEEQARGILAAKTAAREFVLQRLVEDKAWELRTSSAMTATIIRNSFEGLARLTYAQLAKAAEEAGISDGDRQVMSMTTVLAQLAPAA